MDFSQFLFASKIPAHPDPIWFIVPVLLWGVALILLGIFGKKFVKKDVQKALHKTMKKSAFGLKFFGITILILLWFRLEALRFFSIKFWWILYALGFLWFAWSKWRYYRKLDRRIDARENS